MIRFTHEVRALLRRTAVQGSMSCALLLVATPIFGNVAASQGQRAPASFDQDALMLRLDAYTAAQARSQDPADSLFRAAQAAMRRNDNARAASLFRTVRTRYTASPLAADAGYWEAFSLQRVGGQENLTAALEALAEQRVKYPDAASAADARALSARIEGQLASRGDAASAQRITERAQTMSQTCPDEDEDERLMVLDALLTMDSERALPTLKQVLARRDACSVALRRKAVFLVSRKGSGETEDILLNALRTDPDQEVREQAVFWLGQTNSEKSTTALLDLLRSSKDEELLGKVVFSLSQQRNTRASEALRDLARRTDVPREVRGNAIFWLGQRSQSADEAVKFLSELYPTLNDEELKSRTLFAISQRKTPAAQRFITGIALDPKESLEVRRAAIFHAGRAGLSIPDMRQIYRTADDSEIREQVIFAISQKRTAEALDVLMEVASSDSSREMRSKAIFWIGQSKDPRAAEFLLKLLNK